MSTNVDSCPVCGSDSIQVGIKQWCDPEMVEELAERIAVYEGVDGYEWDYYFSLICNMPLQVIEHFFNICTRLEDK